MTHDIVCGLYVTRSGNARPFPTTFIQENTDVLMSTDKDELVPPFLVRSTARAYGVSEQLFADFGHAFMLEPGCERIADALIAWLATLEV